MRRGVGARLVLPVSVSILLALLLLPQAAVYAATQQPCRCYGTVQLNGDWVANGTLITISIDDAVSTWTTDAFIENGQSVYFVDVPADDPETTTKDGGMSGDIIRFAVRYGGTEYPAAQTGVWGVGGFVQVDLAVNTGTPVATLSGQPTGVVNYRTADITVGGTNVVAYKCRLDGASWGGGVDGIGVGTHIGLSLLSEGAHTLQVIGRDEAGDWQPETEPSAASWTVDTTNPTVTLNNTADFVRALTSIGGTAADATPGQLYKVQVEI
ncbi:MAG: hypothetical protein NTU41_13025, partial [Chloroflexi bacterium]|nr:hypothetical protein [Chloroflexota bacterium]